MKNVLFVHNNFPAQFLHLAKALVRRPGLRISAIASATGQEVPGVQLIKYASPEADVSKTHPFARRFDLECHRAEQVMYAAITLAKTGFIPDTIIAHPGWGETLPLRSIFPSARMVTYCEFYYLSKGADLDFDPEFSDNSVDGDIKLHLKNAASLLALAESDFGITPTNWQKSTFPAVLRDQIRVAHEGVDTDLAKPAANASFRLSSGRMLTKKEEIITFVSRCFEPLRGYHTFIRSLPRLLSERPGAEVVLIGGEGRPYGLPPPTGTTWKKQFLNEVAGELDLNRLHFVGHISHADYLRALQISSLHVYLTYPFVVSWSLLEAMSTGCVVIGSNTAPVQEIIDGKNGLLVDFFDHEALAKSAITVLSNRAKYKSFGARARETVLTKYDAKRVCIPQALHLLGLPSTSE